MRLTIEVLILLLLSTVVVGAQAPSPECDLPTAPEVVQNPSRVCFEVSLDHATLDGYALDIVDDGGSVVQTIDMFKPNSITTPNGEVWISWPNLNVQPTSFGSYVSVVRGYANGVSGPDSVASNAWDRTPGPPSGAPRVVDHAFPCDAGWEYRPQLRTWLCDLAEN